MKILTTQTFVVEKDAKAQALKVLEEAAELVEAAKYWDGANRVQAFRVPAEDEAADVLRAFRVPAEDEAADVLQATFNLLDMMGLDYVDVLKALKRCKERNVARGRYAQAASMSTTEPVADGRAELLLAVADDMQKDIDSTKKVEAFGVRHVMWPHDLDERMEEYVARIRRAVK